MTATVFERSTHRPAASRSRRTTGAGRLTVVRSEVAGVDVVTRHTPVLSLPASWQGRAPAGVATPETLDRDFATSGAAAARPAGQLHLTRRGRVVLLALLMLVAVTVFALGRASAGAAITPGSATVTVGSGDTLWSIAHRVAPRRDPRVEVSALEQVNHLIAGAALEPGQTLVLPSTS